MSNTSTSMVINGIVLLDGRATPNVRILLLSAEMDQYLASAITNSAGKYKIKLSTLEPGISMVLVAKVQAPVLAFDYQVIKFDQPVIQQDINIDTFAGNFSTLQGEIIADQAEMPPFIELSITPAHLDNIPPVLGRFFLERDNDTVDTSYYEESVSGNHFKVKVQHGTYRISGQYIIYKGPDSDLPATPNFIVQHIYADDKKDPLPGEPLGGYLLDIKHDRKINMHVQILPKK